MTKTILLNWGKRIFVSLFSLVLFLSVANAQQINLQFKDTPLKTILKELTAQSGYSFAYSDALKQVNEKVTCNIVSNGQIKNVLTKLLKDKGISFKISGKQIVLAPEKIAISDDSAQKKITIRGVVQDVEKEALPGAFISIKGTTNGTSTDINGNFSLEVLRKDILLISYIGFEEKSVSVAAINDVNNFVVTLDPSPLSLDNAVVIGYGTTKRKDLTGSVAHFDTKVIEESTSSNLATMMQGQVSGLSVLSGSGMPGEAAHLEIRGVPSLSGATTPLIVVDGVPMAEGYDLNELNPDDVKSVDILKGASSSSIYGSRAASGVIMVTTKFGQRNSTPEISYTYDYGISTLVSKIRTLTTDEDRKSVV